MPSSWREFSLLLKKLIMTCYWRLFGTEIFSISFQYQEYIFADRDTLKQTMNIERNKQNTFMFLKFFLEEYL